MLSDFYLMLQSDLYLMELSDFYPTLLSDLNIYILSDFHLMILYDLNLKLLSDFYIQLLPNSFWCYHMIHISQYFLTYTFRYCTV